MLFEALTLLCTALFAGAAAYITFVEHPARLEAGTAIALAQWRPSYRRATLMQAPLAMLAFNCAGIAYLQGRSLSVLVAGILLGAVVPYTLMVILPTNRRLLESGRDPASPETDALLQRWGRLHAVRTGASIAALGVLIADLFGRF